MKSNPVVHFEMPIKNKKRVSQFYTKAFGWKMQIMGKEYDNYIVATTTPSTDKGPKKPGAINGGFYQKDKSKPAQYPSVVISVDNIKDSMKKVQKAGGKVLGEPIDIPGIGWYVSFFDTEGNRVTLLQPTR